MPEDDKNKNLEQLRAKADRADSLEVINREQAKKLAFFEAGIKVPEEGPARLVFDTFTPGEGEDITADAVLAYAGKYGVTPGDSDPPAADAEPTTKPPTSGTPAPKMSDAERAHFDAINGAAGGTDADNTSGGDPYVEGYNQFSQAMKGGAKRQNAASAMVGEVMKAASEGNTQALYDQAAWREQHAG